jgi:hypothetical protein
MAKYRLKKEHYLQDKKSKVEPQLHEKGAEIDWDGTPSLHMEPLDKDAKERSAARVADFGERKKEAAARRATGRVGWTPAFEANYERIITRPEASEDAPAQSTSGSAARNGKRKAA